MVYLTLAALVLFGSLVTLVPADHKTHFDRRRQVQVRFRGKRNWRGRKSDRVKPLQLTPLSRLGSSEVVWFLTLRGRGARRGAYRLCGWCSPVALALHSCMVPIRCSSQHENKDTNCESSLYFLNKFLSSIYGFRLANCRFFFLSTYWVFFVCFCIFFFFFFLRSDFFYLTNYDV